jgi:SAM-dependent methyltransferase
LNSKSDETDEFESIIDLGWLAGGICGSHGWATSIQQTIPMIGRLVKWLRLGLARHRLAFPGSPSVGRIWLDSRLRFEELANVDATNEPRLAPYERLAPFYDNYAGHWCLRYDHYLVQLANSHRVPQARVLDLSCGTGGLVMRLAARCDRVVGLDTNPHMLALARDAAHSRENVSILAGDFRQFTLGERFDAVVCASDSLNYVSSDEELEQVVRGISQHLESGGLFVCDVLGRVFSNVVRGKYLHYESPTVRFALSFDFDPETGRANTRVLFPEGVEHHERMAINDHQLMDAARGTNLQLIERFGSLGRRYFAFART